MAFPLSVPGAAVLARTGLGVHVTPDLPFFPEPACL